MSFGRRKREREPSLLLLLLCAVCLHTSAGGKELQEYTLMQVVCNRSSASYNTKRNREAVQHWHQAAGKSVCLLPFVLRGTGGVKVSERQSAVEFFGPDSSPSFSH